MRAAEAVLLGAFRDSLQQNFGDHGLGCALASLQGAQALLLEACRSVDYCRSCLAVGLCKVACRSNARKSVQAAPS